MWRSTATAIDRVLPTWIEPSIDEDLGRSLLRGIALTGGSFRGIKFVSGKKRCAPCLMRILFLPHDDDGGRLRRAQLDLRDKT